MKKNHVLGSNISNLYCKNGKVIYDKKGANTAANLRFKEDHIKLRIYQCEYDNHWHLTKQLRNETKFNLKKKHKSRLTFLNVDEEL